MPPEESQILTYKEQDFCAPCRTWACPRSARNFVNTVKSFCTYTLADSKVMQWKTGVRIITSHQFTYFCIKSNNALNPKILNILKNFSCVFNYHQIERLSEYVKNVYSAKLHILGLNSMMWCLIRR